MQEITYSEKSRELFEKGLKLLNSKDPRDAGKIFLKLTKKEPDVSSAWTGLAELCYKIENYQKCIEYAEEALRVFPQDVDAAFFLGAGYHFIGEQYSAFAEHKKAISLYNQNETFLKKILLLYDQEPTDYQIMTDLAKLVLRVFPYDVEFWYLLSHALRKNGKSLPGAYACHFIEILGVSEEKYKKATIEAYLEARAFQGAYDQCRWHLNSLDNVEEGRFVEYQELLSKIQQEAKSTGVQLRETEYTQEIGNQIFKSVIDFVLNTVPNHRLALEKKGEIIPELSESNPTGEAPLSSKIESGNQERTNPDRDFQQTSLKQFDLPLEEWFERNKSVIVKFASVMENVSESDYELLQKLGFAFPLQSVFLALNDLEKTRQLVVDGNLTE